GDEDRIISHVVGLDVEARVAGGRRAGDGDAVESPLIAGGGRGGGGHGEGSVAGQLHGDTLRLRGDGRRNIDRKRGGRAGDRAANVGQHDGIISGVGGLRVVARVAAGGGAANVRRAETPLVCRRGHASGND